MITKLITKERIQRFIMVLIGTFIYSAAVNMFIIPHKLIGGGVAGIAILLQYLTNISSGYFIFILNVPLFILGVKQLDKEFGIYSFIGMVSMSIFLILTKNITTYYKMNDILLSTLCGGTLSGIGMGIVFRNKASEGGTDIISVIVKKKYGIKISTVTFIINVIIVTLGTFIGGIEAAVYTIISMFMKSYVLDKVIEGLDKKKLIFVITNKPEEIKDVILNKLGRGVTFLYGEGAYTGEQRKIIYSVMTSRQLATVKTIIDDIDDKSVITIMDVAEVQGKGFKKIAF